MRKVREDSPLQKGRISAGGFHPATAPHLQSREKSRGVCDEGKENFLRGDF